MPFCVPVPVSLLQRGLCNVTFFSHAIFFLHFEKSFTKDSLFSLDVDVQIKPMGPWDGS